MTTQYDQLLKKIAAARLEVHPTLADVMARVRVAGLHKVAAQMHQVPVFELKTAAQLLGAKLYARHQRQTKVASGLRALTALSESGALPFDSTAANMRHLGAVKVANLFRLGQGGLKNLVPEAGQAAATTGRAMPKALGSSVAESAQHPGLFSGFGSNVDDLDLAQTVAKMRNEQMSMGVRPFEPKSAPGARHVDVPDEPLFATPPGTSQWDDPVLHRPPARTDISESFLADAKASNAEISRAAQGGPKLNPHLRPVPAEDEQMWRMIYEATKMREAEAAMRNQALPQLHPRNANLGLARTQAAGSPAVPGATRRMDPVPIAPGQTARTPGISPPTLGATRPLRPGTGTGT